ncbi:ABC1 kinase family protein [Iodobacter fluviatilis]|uniref:2-octaprenylphenol hydroxylase n=1 Tax=Iodobacter fluviatilis TaxID=537 RepID=A0A377Q7C2_9NEIS|nr:AarF/UbiB family protein [Iodobacter fluviatilis]TCU89357.1 2-octaprenylphenol hydroxylase [Iodobacter fluviatilis]STQ90727.1 Probable ubiquinone biosynthesis protein UbiB [Iodobacter fluviatilis]
MLKETFTVMRDLPRVREIVAVLVRHGLGNLVQRLGLSKGLERASDLLHLPGNHEAELLESPVRVRRALEELGPAFVKLGQVLATRVDMFPPEWIAEFEKLQSNVPPVDFALILPELTTLLGQDPAGIFLELDPHPVGAASIAQVHRAKLFDGTEVVLKIRRPGIIPKIEADLRILRHIASLMEFEFPESRRYQPVKIAEEFSKSLRRELNFSTEARNSERFAQNFKTHLDIVIPKVYWEWTSESLNVQSYIGGVAGNDLSGVDAAGLDRCILAARGADAVLKMVLIDGYFHADPHPGNVKYLPDNQIAFLDFGMVGRLPHPRRDQIVDLLAALAQRDEHGILNVLLEWTGDTVVDEEKLISDIAGFMFDYENLALKDIRFGNLLNDVVQMMREHQITLPSDLTLLFKALITLEGLGRQLDPNFQMVTHLTPFVKEVILARYSPRSLMKRSKEGVFEAVQLLSGLPRDIGKLIKQARRGNLRIDLDLKRLDQFGQQITRSANRLTMGIVTGALIIGSSIVMTVQAGPTIFGLPLLGFIGFVLAVLNTIWLVLSIWISGKEEI